MGLVLVRLWASFGLFGDVLTCGWIGSGSVIVGELFINIVPPIICVLLLFIWLYWLFCLLLLPLWKSVIVICFVVRYFISILVLQSSWWGRESWFLCLICLPGVSWWLSGSSSRCHGVVCGLWLWYFLIILTIFVMQYIYSVLSSFEIILLRKRAGCFTFIVFLVSCNCLVFFGFSSRWRGLVCSVFVVPGLLWLVDCNAKILFAGWDNFAFYVYLFYLGTFCVYEKAKYKQWPKKLILYKNLRVWRKLGKTSHLAN